MLKVLVVSLSLRRANHSSERCGRLDGTIWEDANTSDEGDRMLSGGVEEFNGEVHVEKVLKIPLPCNLHEGNGIPFPCNLHEGNGDAALW